MPSEFRVSLLRVFWSLISLFVFSGDGRGTYPVSGDGNIPRYTLEACRLGATLTPGHEGLEPRVELGSRFCLTASRLSQDGS